MEIKLVEIWSKVLNIENDKIGIHENFFELGGHSLKAIRLTSFISKELEFKITLKDIFGNQVLEDQSLLLENSKSEEYSQIERVEDAANYSLSDGQKRLWTISQFKGESAAYNLPGYLTLDKSYDTNTFISAVHDVINRHEILRTVFELNENSEIRQRVIQSADFQIEIEFIDLSQSIDKEARKIELINSRAKLEFDLAQGPLIDLALLKLEDDHHVLYYNLHHIIFDGWSENVLTRDLFEFYEAKLEYRIPNLPELRIQYKDYANWQLNGITSVEFQEHKGFWLNQLSGELPVLDLPTKKRPQIKTTNGKIIHFDFS
jgi:acyl carrier protein